jgi:branched-chain amino acid transport system permease protein
MNQNNTLRIAFFALVAVVGIVFQVAVSTSNYWLLVFTDIFILALFALSYNLLFGYTGLLSFGHALFFGTSAYTIGILSLHLGWNYFVGIPVAVLVVVLVAILTGVAVLKLTGVYFAMVTLAIAQLAFVFVESFSEITRGTDGISSIEIPDVLGVTLTDPVVVYYVVLAAFVFVYFALLRLVNSPYGRIIQGIRENEERMEMLGINTYWYKLSVWVISGLFSGIAGILYLLTFTFVDTSLLHWSTTGEILIITLIGGAGAFSGPLIGAIFFVLAEEAIKMFTDSWMLVLGIVFILVVLLYPGGLAEVRETYREGGFGEVYERVRDRMR